MLKRDRDKESKRERQRVGKKTERKGDHLRMATTKVIKEMPVVSKMFCSSTQLVLGIRTRPHAVGGGGFVATDLHTQQVLFRVDGCGVLGKKEEMTLTDAYHNPLLLIRRKGGLVEALNIHRKWKGYTPDYKGSEKPIFTLKEPNPCLASSIRVSIEQKDESIYCRHFEIKGYFPDRECSIIDSGGNVIAQVEVGMSKQVMENKDVYNVVVKPGIDQVFVLGVIAILDYVYDGSTRC